MVCLPPIGTGMSCNRRWRRGGRFGRGLRHARGRRIWHIRSSSSVMITKQNECAGGAKPLRTLCGSPRSPLLLPPLQACRYACTRRCPAGRRGEGRPPSPTVHATPLFDRSWSLGEGGRRRERREGGKRPRRPASPLPPSPQNSASQPGVPVLAQAPAQTFTLFPAISHAPSPPGIAAAGAAPQTPERKFGLRKAQSPRPSGPDERS